MITIINSHTPEKMRLTLEQAGCKIISSSMVPQLNDATATHPDMQIHAVNDNTAFCAPECFAYYRRVLPKRIHLIAGNTRLKGTYPFNCAYNVARVGNYVFCNTESVDPLLIQWYRTNRKIIIPIRQGYAKCNLCPLSDEAFLTEDRGIYNTVIKQNLPVKCFLLPAGEVILDGYPYGFIGGASGGFKEILFWYGNPEYCSFYSQLEKLMQTYHISNISLYDMPLYDLGGIICFP
ncbi:hypothetical protein INF28_03985 [Oscillospiraceae bacterium DSM 107454]|uniref:DUF6873 domain-containing protein n=1 Tax=Ructibacterium gallinarum TaxID=2779355 RepID=A0A9D5LZ61_9FIRM|nr:hypothetical protein [Ructibacterium gallinarum]